MGSVALPVVTVDGGLAAYMREIGKFPMLTVREECELAQRLRDFGDTEAAHRLVTSHLRLVARIAMGYRHYGLAIADLISEGNIGLMRAVRKFDPERGVRLATYAMWWIKASITEYVLASWSLVKTGTAVAQKKLFFRLRRIKSQMGLYGEGEMAPDDVRRIAVALDVPENDVVDMNRRLAGPDKSLNAPLTEDGSVERQDMLVDEAEDQETVYGEREESALRRRLLLQSMESLNPRERRIIEARQLSNTPMTLEELGRDFGISRERARQIETAAMAKLTSAVKSRWVALNAPLALPARSPA
ncbi:MAG: RNA polymerase sigma factor RpoH [Alphaproteobacteria bacterium]|nr:RNA polymerase sigma factor RpoH [Alphaproteobacteria bacterium]MBF0128820.1 RNA polymerase sigma factor RpoH [Alphaproteobacteria bacterium]